MTANASLVDLPNRRVVRRAPSTVGLIGAAFGYAAALTPSLLPHALTFLLLLTALGTLAGYAIGATASWAANKIPWVRHHHPRRWIQFAIVAVIWLPALVFTPVSVGWQAEQQSALDMPSTLPGTVTVVAVTAVVAALLLIAGRSIRLATNKIAAVLTRRAPLHGWVSRRQPSHIHRSVLAVRVAVAGVLIVAGFVAIQVGLGLLISSYNAENADASGQSPARVGANSGSPDSLAPWSTLGREGRFYVSNAMTPAAIEAVTEESAEVPVRVYVGMQQGQTPAERSDLAVAELDRVGAWDREYLAIMAATGTGWIDPDAINSMEIVTGGDVTSVAVQYSAVPSWIGFVVDPETTQVQNDSTVNAILAAWRAKPEGERPTLILFGESLGAFGSQAAWPEGSTPQEVTAEIKHIVWIGPPSQSRLWKQWQADRTAGPMWQPVIGDAAIARTYISDVELEQAIPSEGPVITFSAHPNDPVVYWSPDLLLQKPDWLDQPLGPGVDPHMRWFPVITYLQVGMDLISGGAPPEVGHNYAADAGPAIALTVNPAGWTPAKTQSLVKALPSLHYETG
ncbi:MAG: alpha/beta-hydrolase family protein [Candidatus Nanopelagicales bacterium]